MHFCRVFYCNINLREQPLGQWLVQCHGLAIDGPGSIHDLNEPLVSLFSPGWMDGWMDVRLLDNHLHDLTEKNIDPAHTTTRDVASIKIFSAAFAYPQAQSAGD
jgi:hypothetical protein